MSKKGILGQQTCEAIVFDDYGDGNPGADPFMRSILRGVEEAGWEAQAFFHPNVASNALSIYSGALITGLGLLRRLTEEEQRLKNMGEDVPTSSSEVFRKTGKFPAE